jgi:3-isopropylmalate dehydrogenase
MKITILPVTELARKSCAGPKCCGSHRDGLSLESEEALVGGAAFDKTGVPLPDATLRIAQHADAVLFGAVGGPAYDTLPRDKRPERALLQLRKALGTFANLRPAIVYAEVAGASTLKPEIVAGLIS